MYRVAVIQNQSEAFELSYGNVIKVLQKHFLKYTWDLFATEEGMSQLVTNLEHYDAIIFTSNALNDVSVQQFWLDSSRNNVFETFLRNGQGILILHQIKMIGKNYTFLGKEWSVMVQKREHGIGPKLDRPVDGVLSINTSHLVVEYPRPIDPTLLAEQARTNPNLPVLYIHSIQPVNPEYWISVIQDTTYTLVRPLLLISGAHTEGRIAVTSFAPDWQEQLDLLTNLITYVVEGHQSVTIIQRTGKRSYDFEYMISYLNIHKVAYREYWAEKIDEAPLATNVHSMAIIAPTWTADEMTPEALIKLKQRLRPEGKLIYFDLLANQVPVVTAIGGQMPFKMQYRDSIISLKSTYDYNTGLWDGSFLRTMHVLEALLTFGEPVHEYKIPTLQYVLAHDLEGSYDGTFIPTCEMARLYYIFGEANRFKATIAWIQKKLTTLQKSAPDFVRAYAIFHLCNIKVNQLALEALKSILSTPPDSIVNLVRYLQTAIAFDFTEQISQLANFLLDQQLEDGSWGLEQVNRTMLTAAVVDTLIQARPFLPQVPARTPSIQDVIQKGITYLHTYNFSRIVGRQQTATVAMALQAIYRFSNDISLPIEDFADSQRLIQNRTRNATTIDVATKFISTLQSKISTLLTQKAELEKAYSKLSERYSNAQYFILAMIIFLFVSGLLFTYAAFNTPDFMKDLTIDVVGTTKNWLLPYWWLLVLPVCLWLIIILIRVGLLPRFVLRVIQFIGSLFNVSLKETELTDQEE